MGSVPTTAWAFADEDAIVRRAVTVGLVRAMARKRGVKRWDAMVRECQCYVVCRVKETRTSYAGMDTFVVVFVNRGWLEGTNPKKARSHERVTSTWEFSERTSQRASHTAIDKTLSTLLSALPLVCSTSKTKVLGIRRSSALHHLNTAPVHGHHVWCSADAG